MEEKNNVFESTEENEAVIREMIKQADKYWEDARKRVLKIASQMRVEFELDWHDDEFLYEVFDGGRYNPTDDEIKSDIMEYIEEENDEL